MSGFFGKTPFRLRYVRHCSPSRQSPFANRTGTAISDRDSEGLDETSSTQLTQCAGAIATANVNSADNPLGTVNTHDSAYVLGPRPFKLTVQGPAATRTTATNKSNAAAALRSCQLSSREASGGRAQRDANVGDAAEGRLNSTPKRQSPSALTHRRRRGYRVSRAQQSGRRSRDLKSGTSKDVRLISQSSTEAFTETTSEAASTGPEEGSEGDGEVESLERGFEPDNREQRVKESTLGKTTASLMSLRAGRSPKSGRRKQQSRERYSLERHRNERHIYKQMSGRDTEAMDAGDPQRGSERSLNRSAVGDRDARPAAIASSFIEEEHSTETRERMKAEDAGTESQARSEVEKGGVAHVDLDAKIREEDSVVVSPFRSSATSDYARDGRLPNFPNPVAMPRTLPLEKSPASASTRASPSPSIRPLPGTLEIEAPSKAAPLPPAPLSEKEVAAEIDAKESREEAVLSDKWQSMLAKLEKVAGHRDCRIPHAILQDLQNDVLAFIRAEMFEPKFLIHPTLQLPSKALNNDPALAAIAAKIVFTGTEIESIEKAMKPVAVLLKEPGVTFFTSSNLRKSSSKSAHGTKSIADIEEFLGEIKCGPTAGREIVGHAVRSVHDFPIIAYGQGSIDPEYSSRLRKLTPDMDTSERWRTMSQAACPFRAVIFLEDREKRNDGKEHTNLKGAHTLRRPTKSVKAAWKLLGSIVTDWRWHLVRCSYESANKYARFLPALDALPSSVLAKAGWSEVALDNCCIRWRNLEGGLIFSYLSGDAEASVDKTLALCYDGDSHKNWIPFLSDTQRLLSVTSGTFCFKYGVSLPWPLSRREMSIVGMSTDSLASSPLHSFQMWGNNVPEVATSFFGIPIPKASSGSVSMEMPVLSFSLTPIRPNRTRVTMVSVMDVKISFLPQSVQNYMAKHMASKLFGNVQKICKNFDKSQYKQVLEANKELFDDILTDLPVALKVHENSKEYTKR